MDKETKSTMREFASNDQANYYSGITSITVNGKNAYELKGKFLDDLHKNAFSGTNREDAVKNIEYFLKIVDPIDLPNVNQDKLRVVVFPILLITRMAGYTSGIKICHGCTRNHGWKMEHGAYIIGNSLHYQDYEWYDALKDSKLKEEALHNKAIIEGRIDDNDELSDDG
ncbi:hypothetical protein Tco_1117158 [Tanacetum coccineum]